MRNKRPHFGGHPTFTVAPSGPLINTGMKQHKFNFSFDQIPQYQYCDITVGMTIGTFTKY